jgi:cytochrome c553
MPLPPVMAAMTPLPPELIGHVGRWKPEELFYIVKHGIKFTGMPAWPVQQRDDEVWAVVAFLLRLPGLDAAAYRALVYGSTNASDPTGLLPLTSQGQPAPRAVRDACWRCHGTDGQGRWGAFPSLAGQRAEYLYRSLRAFATGQRLSGIMTGIAATLDDQAMRGVASYYEGLAPRTPAASPDLAAAQRGETIMRHGVPDRDVPACVECHGPAATPRNAGYPQLAGQHAEYLRSQLRLFQERRRGGSGYQNLMHVFVGRLRPDEIADVTRFYATLAARVR